MTIKEFIYGTFSEPGVGGPSFARIAPTVILAFVLSWDSYIVFFRGQGIPANLTDQAIFVMALYGANKFSTAVASFSNSVAAKKV